MRKRTVNRKKYCEVRHLTTEGTLVTTVGNDITLETPKATVTRIPTKLANLEWLMRDVLSTPYSTIIA